MFLKKKDFFGRPLPPSPGEEAQAGAQAAGRPLPETGGGTGLCVKDHDLLQRLHALEACCKEAGRRDLLEQLFDLRTYLSSAKFTVAVVGEFNRGKSTLVNRLIGLDIIPTSIVPATASLVRVSGGDSEGITLRSKRGEQKFPLDKSSWDAIEKEKAGLPYEVAITRNCPLLTEYDLELLDTPGVNSRISGDLTMAEQAISQCDCGIMPMDATAAFSTSETLFLQERLLVKKVPRVMVVLTKLDLVKEQERSSVVKLVRDKLSAISPEIPLYLSAAGMAEGWEACSGTEAIRGQLLQWLRESDHIRLKRERAAGALRDIAADLSSVYQCQLEVLAENEDRRKLVAEQKKKQLFQDSQMSWDALEIDMLQRCNRNFEWIRSMTEERQADLMDRLLLELSHANVPKEWWERDYPYRIRMEMVALGNMLENNLQGFYTRDMGWLNHQLQEKYGVAVPPQSRRIAEKAVFRSPVLQEDLELADLRRARTVSRVSTGALTIAGYAVGGVLGFSPIGMAIGIGSGVLSEIFLNKQVELQKRRLSAVIRRELPVAYSKSIETVEENIRRYYTETIGTMKESCSSWAKVKCDAVDAAQAQGGGPDAAEEIRAKLAMLQNLAGL